MKKVLFLLCMFAMFISFIFIVSCSKKEEAVTHELFGQGIDTLVMGKSFEPIFYITSPPANVSFYLEGPLKDCKEVAGQIYFDTTSDSLYVHEDMLFIHNDSIFQKNEYNKKYWIIPSFTWTPSAPQVVGDQMYCFVVQSIWGKEGRPCVTIRNYIYIKEN